MLSAIKKYKESCDSDWGRDIVQGRLVQGADVWADTLVQRSWGEGVQAEGRDLRVELKRCQGAWILETKGESSGDVQECRQGQIM